jgi:hypothetical protein
MSAVVAIDATITNTTSVAASVAKALWQHWQLCCFGSSGWNSCYDKNQQRVELFFKDATC